LYCHLSIAFIEYKYFQHHIAEFRKEVANAMDKFVDKDQEKRDNAKEKLEAAKRKKKGYRSSFFTL